MKGYSFRSLTDLVLKIFKTKVNAGTGLSGGGSLEADRTLSVKYGTAAGTATQGNDSRLSDSREWTAATIGQAETEAGTASTRRAFTAQRVRQAIVAWWIGITGTFGRDLVTSTNAITARVKLGLGEHALRWPTWGEVTGKPSTFTPTSHTHPWGQITEKPPQSLRWPSWAEVTGKPDPWPVGVCYTQYPGTPTPQSIFGGSWKKLFANEGVFFRTEGGKSLPFGAGIQSDENKSHSHSGVATGSGAHSHTRGTMNITGAVTINQIANSGTGAFFRSSASAAASQSLSGYSGSRYTFDASRSWTGNTSQAPAHTHPLSINSSGDEARPINRTIVVWQRTA